MRGEEAEAGHSREEGTLEWQLMQARSQVASMLHPPHPASAVLHPFYASTLQESQFSRASFANHLHQVRSSIRKFIDETSTASITAQHDDSSQNDVQSESKAKKQRIISLLRENASHSTAITTAARQLQQTNDWDTLLNTSQDAPSSDKAMQDSRKQIEHFVQTCEMMAKDLKMEAFADVHSGVEEEQTTHTHTLTIAASIIVVDVEVFLERQSDERYKPLIRIRLSYATDSTTSKPVYRDQNLAECLRIDLQAVAESLLGWQSEADVQDAVIDGISALMQHQRRAKRILEVHKRLDDLSTALSGSSKESSFPDLFAALDDVGKKLQAMLQVSPRSVEQISAGGGLLMQHIGSPYTSIVYHADADLLSTTISDVEKQLDRHTLSLTEGSPRLHYINITVAESTSKVLQTANSATALPKIDVGEGNGAAHLFEAVLHPPVVMSKKSARLLSTKAGVLLGKHSTKSIKQVDHSMSTITKAPSYEDMVSTQNGGKDGDSISQFVPPSASLPDVEHQAVVVSRFPFASLQHLKEVTIQLRQQVQLNKLLNAVTRSVSTSAGKGEEVTLQDLLSDTKHSNTISTFQVSLVAEEKSGLYTVFINVPLGIDIWTLEVKMSIQEGHWTIDATVCKIAQENGKHSLEKGSDLYCESITLLDQGDEEGLNKVVGSLRRWAVLYVKEGSPSQKGMTAPPQSIGMADTDQLGPLPDAGKISPSREIRESRSKSRRGSLVESGSTTTDSSNTGVRTRRRSNAQSPVLADKDVSRSTSSNNSKRRASQAGLEEEEGQKRASRKKN